MTTGTEGRDARRSAPLQCAANKTRSRTEARLVDCLSPATVLWAWEAYPAYDEQAGEKWLFLKPVKWNAHVQYAWRYDPCELAARSGRRATASPNVRHRAAMTTTAARIDPWVTDDEYDPSDDFE